MNDDFDPGTEWREAHEDEDFPAGTRVIREHIIGERNYERTWIRINSIPLLPTIPYTVIRVTPPDELPPALYVHDGHRVALVSSNAWIDWIDERCVVELLSEPRAITTKAIFSRLREYNGLIVGESDEFDSIERDFGVEP